MLAFWLIVIHFYVFIVSLILFSFYLFTAIQTNELTDARKTHRLFSRERTQRLDQWVTAVHSIHRSALKRRIPVAAADFEDTQELYGVRPVDPKRAKLLGFQPRLLSYERQAETYVPEISPDSRRCDLWNTRQDNRYLVKCQVAEGDAACFNCIESRRFNRYCIHVPTLLQIHLGFAYNGMPESAAENVTMLSSEFDTGSDVLDIPANESPDEGYCLPAVFKNIVHQDGAWKPTDEARNCNPNTGDWLLARLSVTGDTSYNWVCRCRYPNLMTNVSTVFSDCMRPVGCHPHGELDEETRLGRRNPYTQGECVCDAGYRAGRDAAIGPTCLPRVVVGEDDLPQDVYERYGLSTAAMLRWPDDQRLLDSRVATLAGNNPRGVALPNPCRYDVLTGKLLPEARSCLLVTEQIEGEWTAYCVFQNYDAVPVRSSRDYLRNNNGEYSNACLLIDIGHTDTTNTQNSILSYQVSREVEDPRPDFGVLIAKSATLGRIFDSVADDAAYREFMSHVRPPASVSNQLPDKSVVIAAGSVADWCSVYEQVPIRSIESNGLKTLIVRRYASPFLDGHVVYNLRERQYFWYVVDNPFGNTHWNHGTRDDFYQLLQVLGIPGNSLNEFYIRNGALVFKKLQDKTRDFRVGFSNYIRETVHAAPIRYPYRRFTIPFASGSDIDDDLYSDRYYHTIWPTYAPPSSSRPKDKPYMPFVYNTDFDYGDCTLTLHDNAGRYGVVLMAEQLCGNYRNHRQRMRNRLQQKWV